MHEDVRVTLEDKLERGRSSLIVVDVQNDFCSPDGYLGKIGGDLSMVEAMLPKLQALIDQAREAGVVVVFVQAIYDEQFLSRSWKERNIRLNVDVPRCLTGSWGADFYKVKPRQGDLVVCKHRYSAFIDTELDMILRGKGIETLIMTGVTTNVCVESTARDGFMKDYYIVFTDDCTAATSRQHQEMSLQNIRDAFGVVVSSEEIIQVWGRR